MHRVFVANRGECASRVARAVTALGWHAVVPPANADLNFFLSPERLAKAAVDERCSMLHPGWGFLSESRRLADSCDEQGIRFVGPCADALDAFADKLRAREFAGRVGLPIVEASPMLASPGDAARFANGRDIVLKAAAGGGGKGIRVVYAGEDVESAFARCQSEALSAFGDGTVYAELLVRDCRHIEVQVVGDAQGNVQHLYERDCSLQRRHQKIIELAPSPFISDQVREAVVHDALRLARACPWRPLVACTFEFLVTPQQHYFLEVNARLQVEHGITEMVSGVDLVQTQLRLARGELLSACLGAMPKSPQRFAVEARVTATSVGTLTELSFPSVLAGEQRIDAGEHLAVGQHITADFDPMLFKAMASGASLTEALTLLRALLDNVRLAGVHTNMVELHALLGRGIAGEFANMTTGALDAEDAARVEQERTRLLAQADTIVAVRMPFTATLVEVHVRDGEHIGAGAPVATVRHMKMEHTLRAACDGTVGCSDAIPATTGTTLEAGTLLVSLERSALPSSSAQRRVERVHQHLAADSRQAEVDELARRHAMALELGGAEAVARHKKAGKLTCRERLAALLDEGSLREIGSLAGKGVYNDETGALESFTPANFVGGRGTVDARPIVVGADDFTVRAGHADGGNFRKAVYIEEMAREWRVPMVRLIDGASGGGSITLLKEYGATYVPPLFGMTSSMAMMAEIPVVAAVLGSVVGLGAAKAVLSHFSVMVRDTAQLFAAGPPIVAHATGENVDKNTLGGTDVHGPNGTVDNVVDNEREAIASVRRFLSYLPTNAWELTPRIDPQRLSGDDVVDRAIARSRMQEELLSLVPRNRRASIDVRRIVECVVDDNSFFEIGRLHGVDVVCGLARVDGRAIGVLASDSATPSGGCLTAAGAQKLRRHVDLCDSFHLPMLSFVDQPGFHVGVAAEAAGTLRHGASAMAAMYEATIPWFSVIIRRCYGVGGAALVDRGDPDVRVAWPSAEWGSLPPEGGVEAGFRRQLASAGDQAEAMRQSIMAEYAKLSSPMRTAEQFGIEEIIDPRQTRLLACEWAELAYRKMQHDVRPIGRRYRP